MITSIKFSDEQLQRTGLKTRVIDGLGSLVVLAGPNGGGKSRLLYLVHERAQRYATVAQALNQVLAIRDLSPPERELEARRRKEFEAETEWLTSRDWQNFRVSSLPYASSIGIQELASLSPSAADNIYRDAGSQGLVTARSAMQVYVYRAMETLWNARHPDIASVVSGASAKATVFCDMVEHLLRGKLDYTIDSQTLRPLPRLRGRPFEPNRLSPGERVLMDWAIMLHSQDAAELAGRVVIIDEPEQHLHPEICWRTISRLREALGETGQLWVATHSLPLAAQADQADLLFVEDGATLRANRNPSRVWQSLLGGADARERLLMFLDADADIACARYAAQCLLPPTVRDASGVLTDDPQGAQLMAALRERGGTGAIRVLEYGAGKGRLAQFVADRVRGEKTSQLSFIAYNDGSIVLPDEREACKLAVEQLTSAGVVAKYTEVFGELHARESDRFDVIVLANVLHEIPTNEWPELFRRLAQCARDGGQVLVIEDQEPRLGELPHPRGYLLLEKDEWRKLLDDEVLSQRTSWNGRDLTAFLFSASRLGSVTEVRLKDTLGDVQRRCRDEILRLRRSDDRSAASGRRHALYAIMHVNATLARE